MRDSWFQSVTNVESYIFCIERIHIVLVPIETGQIFKLSIVQNSFTKHYQSEEMPYDKFLRLRTLPFDPKTCNSIENFVIERYTQIID